MSQMLTTMPVNRTPCRFDMFTRRKKGSVMPVKNAQEVFTYRGDQYSKEPDKMLKLLVNMVVNYRKQYAVMMIRDNTKPPHHPEHVILKILNGVPKVNRLANYPELICNIPLPEYLSYELTD
jgi:hypothetical protein